MPTYITLYRYTQEGIKNIKDGPDRLEAGKAALRGAGGELIGFFLTMSQYDAVTVSTAPDDETAATLALAIGSQGAVSTETLRAFTEEEYRRIIARLP